ncbi:protein FAR1-RELATED SEQUENCE 5-like [Salvia miltiorrhiza]|uniref:protein FAR1-RELATED SEQUENCE 5-like n=1 Tax=Salvia miltiorrhiza TaxID=226208 RepID=UPI0025AD6436|nr:protein FAR1-RELATED SEQUENCE 5-like [Salvia miltiorrhiza]
MDDTRYPAYEENKTGELIIPECEAKSKPFVGQIFPNLDVGCKFYDDYAELCGFTSRKSTSTKDDDGTIILYYVLCNREGIPPKPDESLMPKSKRSTKKRKRTSCKVNCRAQIIFQISDFGMYNVRTFIEGHNHTMVPTVSRHLMPVNKNVTPAHEMWITSVIKANIGPIRSFRMYREIMGEYEDIGCVSNDFKNFVRDLNVYALDSDAHMILQTFLNKKELGNGFQYFYDVDDENRLRRLIWTDEVSVKNYKLFGEAVSFDATYNTNRDNHGKCLSFGAATISQEDVDSYSWVLEKFVECVGNAPPLLITDQDPGLKKAVAAVWPQTRHRYCMWHITMKENWQNLMDEYDLSDNRWFSDMFDDRSHWIPAYFRDVSMSGLFRTTSLSESENSYFKRALEAQRHNYHKTTFADETGVLPMKTRLKIEKHAATIYTNNIFKEIQDEIDDSQTHCNMYKMEEQVDESIYTVHDNVDGKFVVRHRLSDTYTSCSCNLCIGYVGDNQVLREELLAALIEVEKRFAKERAVQSLS